MTKRKVNSPLTSPVCFRVSDCSDFLSFLRLFSDFPGSSVERTTDHLIFTYSLNFASDRPEFVERLITSRVPFTRFMSFAFDDPTCEGVSEIHISLSNFLRIFLYIMRTNSLNHLKLL